MSSSSDVNMLRLETPVTRLQITDSSGPTQTALEIIGPTSWVRMIVHQHHQAQQDLHQLYELCGQAFDQSDRRLRHFEQAYNTLYRGTLYIYERAVANVSHQWLQTELSKAANAYQTFGREVWQAIVERTTETDLRVVYQATQVAWLHDAVAFLMEANAARHANLTTFTDQVSDWATRQNNATARLQQQLADAQAQIDQLARQRVEVPLPPSNPTTLRSTPMVSPQRPMFLQGATRR
jgi:hypothetical protein